MVQHLTALKGHKVNEAMMTNYTLLKPDDDMQTLADILLAGTERHFIVAQGDEVVGVLYHENIIAALTRKKTGVTAGDLMDRDFQRIDPDDELTEVYRMVQERRHNFFPVTENGKLLGTIDMENINEFMMIRAGLDY